VTATVAVTYDRLGNIRSRSDVGTYYYGIETGGTGGTGSATDPNCALGYNRPHAVRAVAGAKNAAYCYDANGDMTSGDGRTVTWSAFGMPTHIARGLRSIEIAYGPERALQLICAPSARPRRHQRDRRDDDALRRRRGVRSGDERRLGPDHAARLHRRRGDRHRCAGDA
jgi:hypothetical protein